MMANTWLFKVRASSAVKIAYMNDKHLYDENYGIVHRKNDTHKDIFI
jgi:hypothetical protein